MVLDTSAKLLRLAELFKFTLADASELFFTPFEQDITFLSDDYIPAPIEANDIERDVELDVGELKVIFPFHADYISKSQLVNDRYMDGCQLELYHVDRANLASYRMPFIGTAGEVRCNNTGVEVTFKNEFKMLKKLFPPILYGPTCSRSHGDSGCTINPDDFDEPGAAEAGTTAIKIIDAANRTEANGYWDGGYAEMTSGTYSGKKRMVVPYTTGSVEFVIPLDGAPAVADTYKVFPHCRKQFARCRDIFSNEINFLGFPNIPNPVEAMS